MSHCRCDECEQPVLPRDSYAVTWTEWSTQDQRHIKHLYPGTFHGGCVRRAKERLDRERKGDATGGGT